METALLGRTGPGRAGPGRAGPGRAGPGLAMPRAETGRALNSNSGPRAGPGREVYGPGRADKIRPVQISDTEPAIYYCILVNKEYISWIAVIEQMNTGARC